GGGEKGRERGGGKGLGLQFEGAVLPPAAAQRGLRMGALVPLDDPRRSQLRGARGGHHVDPNAPDLLDLDDEAATRPQYIAPLMASDPLASANFQVVDRSSERRKLMIEVPRL